MEDSALIATEIQATPHAKWSKILYILLAILIPLMITGTLAEGYGGAEFAERLIYCRWYFLGTLLLIFLYIVLAFCSNLPFKRSLIGIYLMQTGCIFFGLAYLITYWNHSSGTMTLLPNTPSNEVALSDDIMTVTYTGKDNHAKSFTLPYSAFSTPLHDSFRDVALTTFLPFSDKILNWTYPTGQNPGTFPSSHYQIKRTDTEPYLDLDMVFSLHPEAKDFPSTLTIPPVEIRYLPQEVAPCFDRIGASKIIFWDLQSNVCFTPEEQKIAVQEPVVGKRFLAIKRDHYFQSFFPDFSPYPLTQDLNPMKDSPVRVMALNTFEGGQYLFLMGPSLAFMKEGAWVKESLQLGHPFTLQKFMLDITLLYHTIEKMPEKIPHFIYPTHTSGREKAVEVFIQGRSYWVTSSQPLQLEINKQLVTLQLKKKTREIPFHVSLSEIQPEGNTLRISGAEHSGHYLISSNHPLHIDGVSFYQKENLEKAAIFTVNLTPGHSLKYIGLLMAFVGLVIYCFFHKKEEA